MRCRKRYKPRDLLFGCAGVELLRKSTFRVSYELPLAKKQAPCPRTFTLLPVDREKCDPVKFLSKAVLGKKARLTLLSEHSLKPVISVDFTITVKCLKLLGPVARIGSRVLRTFSIPLTGEYAREIVDSARFMSAAAELQNKTAWHTGAELDILQRFFAEIDVAPFYGGMQFVEIKGKGYFWVSKEEAETFAEEVPQGYPTCNGGDNRASLS